MTLLGKRILVVDDEKDMRNLIRDVLRTDQAAVKIATNGKDALAIASQYPLHAIVSDLRMHSGSGLFLLREIKKIKPDLKFVMITGYDDATKDDLLKAGCDLFFPKPFDPEEFLEQLDRLLTG